MPYDTWKPRDDSVKHFERVLRQHSRVSGFSRQGTQIFYIERSEGLGPLVVLLTDIYTVGLADVMQARDTVDGLNCIVTVSNWNGYTQEGREYAEERHIGLFVLSELMGALWKEEFWKYVKRDSDGKPVLRYRRSSA